MTPRRPTHPGPHPPRPPHPGPYPPGPHQRGPLARSGAARLDRRRLLRSGLLLGTAAAGSAAVAACGGGGDTTAVPEANPDNALIAAFPRSVPYVAAGVPARLPFLISDREGVPLSSIDGPVTFTVRAGSEQVGAPIEVAPRSVDVPRAYLPLNVNLPSPGFYDVVADYGGAELTSALQVYAPEDVTIPGVGEPLPAAQTPTFTNTLEVDPVCSRPTPCPFHGTDLADLIGNGRPKVVMVATPAFCQTAVCGPVLDLLVEEASGRSDLDVVHTEVYKDPKAVRDLAEATLAPLPEAYTLTFEPAMFVTDAGGTIVARADVTVDRTEMAELIALAT